MRQCPSSARIAARHCGFTRRRVHRRWKVIQVLRVPLDAIDADTMRRTETAQQARLPFRILFGGCALGPRPCCWRLELYSNLQGLRVFPGAVPEFAKHGAAAGTRRLEAAPASIAVFPDTLVPRLFFDVYWRLAPCAEKRSAKAQRW